MPIATTVVAVVIAIVVVSTAAAARAEEWNLQLEVGSELDSNVHRTTGDNTGVLSANGRVGARLGLGFRPLEHGYVRLSALGAAKLFPGEDASSEDVAVLATDGRFNLTLDSISPSLRLAYYDSAAPGGAALAMRTGDATVGLDLNTEDGHQLSVSAGYRFFSYKPDNDFDFHGAHIGAAFTGRIRAVDTSWQLRYAVAYTASMRGYDSPALANRCPDGTPVQRDCLLVTAATRADLFHDGAVDLSYTRSFILGLRYGLQFNDSNSFGQSLVRHRIELSGTTELFAEIYLNAKLVLQLNQFVDTLLLGGDVGTFISIEDETRNGLVVHLTRELGETWLIEVRYAFYANAFTPDASPYRRHTAYLGLVYSWKPSR